ncbi:aldehyde dehydrogenase [Haloechinothrix sp. LS1_15]|uniref:aldehyde dehydrogenase n=1 Tax=Haloechinothrix sp. LS1_15 TaxID=2652248 RepID=UPI002945819E|nr:aldehyde dehydrogenase [Haloechinothrix sp. LS1_15]MDV6014097.1 aldehyde dehydrogenase [Haloechinothrix sp. LS1_15]
MIPANPPARLLVDGKLRGTRSGAEFPIVNPATEAVIGRAPDATADDMDAAIAAARRAFDETSWSADLSWRLHCLKQLHRALVGAGEEMRALTTAEAGAPAFLTSGPQYDVPVESFRWTVGLAESFPWTEDLGTASPMGIPTRRTVVREAVGVVGAITPWNFPNQINLAKLGPALAAGNTVVLKPAPDTPWVAAELARLAAEHTDLPPGVLNVVSTTDDTVAVRLATDERVDVVSFTGSTATGRQVMAAAAPTLKKVFLELGGKSAAIVLDDADLAGAVGTAAFSVCVHAGQGCALTTRLLVPRERYDEAVEVAATTMRAIGTGDPTDPGTVCGPLISAAQRDRVESYLDLAVAEGGRFATGGGRPDRDRGFWIEPTVITGLDNSTRVAREEIFGPVLVVIPHDGDDDAVRIANDSPYGLSGSVDSGDPERARAVAGRIRTGTLAVNGGVWFAADAPFGGYKQSGIGREMGVDGFREYLETKLVAEPAGGDT